jgi:membrane protease YdiL (CAAX protease family)
MMRTAQPLKERVQILIGLTLALGLPILPLGGWGERLKLFGPLVGHEVLWWLAVAVVLFFVLRVEKRQLSSIGVRRLRPRDVAVAILAGILMVTGTVLIASEILPRFHFQTNMDQFHTWIGAPLWYRFILVLRAAIAEEILFRAYPLERLVELTGSRFLAATISWAAFTVAHLRTWGAAYLIMAGFYGVILTLLYLWRRNLFSNIIAHWILDAAIYLLQ